MPHSKSDNSLDSNKWRHLSCSFASECDLQAPVNDMRAPYLSKSLPAAHIVTNIAGKVITKDGARTAMYIPLMRNAIVECCKVISWLQC